MGQNYKSPLDVERIEPYIPYSSGRFTKVIGFVFGLLLLLVIIVSMIIGWIIAVILGFGG